jgi:7,8-dihydropterin-6-yl-methyl-4-(beta-D-ribofuranosyl)aminobenzene 5'-phosphate synthase
MNFRVSPVWWPLLAATFPISMPWLAIKALRFDKGKKSVEKLNTDRIESAEPLKLPVLKRMEITVVVEMEAEEGFEKDAGVSYLIKTDRGSLLMDVGFGPERPAFAFNASRLALTTDSIDALVISHPHPDHMGGLAATRAHRVMVPRDFVVGQKKPCYATGSSASEDFNVRSVERPRLLEAGLATTGPLARMDFFFGLIEEQALIAHVEGKGVVILTGCGHPTVEVILKMARRLTTEPVYAIGGGLHFPITKSRGARMGIEFQQVLGTGKPFWQRITDNDLTKTIGTLNDIAPKRLFLSAHDTCDHALARLKKEVTADVEVFRAGATYNLAD